MTKLTAKNVKFTRSVGTTRLPNTAVYDTATLVKTIDNPNIYGSSSSDNFGYEIHTDGSHIIVGVPNEDSVQGLYSGAAYIFDMDGNLIHSLANPNDFSTQFDDNFGNSVGIHGNYAIVGAWGEDSSGSGSVGKAYIFDVTTGNLFRTLNTPEYGGGYVGMSCAISGDYAIVGIQTNAAGTAGGTSGSALVYSIATGNLVHQIDNPSLYSTANGDQFAYDRLMHVHGNNLLVCSYSEDALDGTSSGAAYVFDLTTGGLTYSFANPNSYSTSVFDHFGQGADIGDKYIAIGSWRESGPSGPDEGVVYVYDLSTGSLQYTLTNPNNYSTATDDRFGYDVAVHGDYLVVGAPREDSASGTEVGIVYVYDLTTGNLVITIDNPDAYSNTFADWFGNRVEIHGNKIIAAAWFEGDAGGLNSGKVYIFDLSTA